MSYNRQVMYDYNARPTRPRGRFQASRLVRYTLVCGGGAALFALAFWFLQPNDERDSNAPEITLKLPSQSLDSNTDAPTDSRRRIPFEPRTALNHGPNSDLPAEHIAGDEWTTVEIKPGDNLSLIFARHGFSKKDLHAILNVNATTKALRQIKPGQSIRMKVDKDGHVLGLIHEIDYLKSLHVEHKDNAFEASIIETQPEYRFGTALARINQSLFLDGQATGLSDATIMALTDIFGWDIDFVLDVRKGDQFSVVFEEIIKNGKKIKDGKILAAEFVNRGRKLRAVHYANRDGHSGYYSDTGAAMRKAFLRAPVNFTRISSKFNLKRRHPILNKLRAHKGVDYAAPHGTPIRATANGKVVHVGTKGGYGKTIVIKHGDSYSTLFAHMSRYARGMKKGSRVKQGQTIGYVGKTGLATGPHLHYEFLVNGVHKNPLKVNLPKALPIEKKYIDDFRAKAAPLLAQLDELDASENSDKLVAQLEVADPRPGRDATVPSTR